MVKCQFLYSKWVLYGWILHETRWARREHSIDTSFNVVGLLHHVLISNLFLRFFPTAFPQHILFTRNGKSEARGFYLSADVLFFIQIRCDRLRSRVETCITVIYGFIFVVFTRDVEKGVMRRKERRGGRNNKEEGAIRTKER